MISTEFNTYTILYADDDPDDVFLFENALRESELQYLFLNFSTGVDLLESIKQNDYSSPVIFLDLNMPLKTGIECLEEIKADESLKTIPVFIISTSNAEAYSTTALSKGAHAYIQKPSEYHLLKENIRTAVLSCAAVYNSQK